MVYFSNIYIFNTMGIWEHFGNNEPTDNRLNAEDQSFLCRAINLHKMLNVFFDIMPYFISLMYSVVLYTSLVSS